MIPAWMVLVGCTDGFIESMFSDPASTESWSWSTATGDGPDVTAADAGCAAAEGWSATVVADGWTSDATFTMFDAATRAAEDVAMDLVGTDPDGAWDERAAGPLAPGVDTAFDCGDAARLSFAVRVYDPRGALSDCVAWGLDVIEMFDWLWDHDLDVVELPGGCRALE